MPDDVILEDAMGGMPPATAQTLPQPPQPPPAPVPPPDLSQPLVDPDEAPPTEEEPPTEPENEGDPDAPQPGQRRSVVGDLVRERERRQIIEQNLTQSQDLIRQVMSLPGGMELLQAAATGQPPPERPTRPGELSAEDQALVQEAQEVAQDLGLYDAQGKPDLKTAARIVLRDRKRTETMVKQALGPLQQTTMSLAAQPVIQRVLAVADQFGIDRNLVWQGLQATPPEHLGNPEVQQAVLMMALGTQTMLGSGQQPQQQPNGQRQPLPRGTPMQRMGARPPLFTEAPGGRPRATAQLDEVFRERLRSTGMKDETINASLERFVPGAPNRLE
jgi:hypothetical protein